MSVTRRLTGNSRFARQLLEAGMDKVEEGLDEVGADAVRRADANVEKLYNTGRTGYQVKDIGDRLAGSFYYEVTRSPGGGLPATIALKSTSDPEKVNALEYGSDPHVIKAKHAAKGMLVFEATGGAPSKNQQKFDKSFARKRTTQKNAKPRARTGRDKLVITESVKHPGTRRGWFMHDALESAVRAAYKAVVKLR